MGESDRVRSLGMLNNIIVFILENNYNCHIPMESIGGAVLSQENMQLAEMSNKQEIVKRLKRIEGQVRGIQKMIEEDKYCADILTQVAAVRSAVNKVGGMVLEHHSKTCMSNAFKSGEGEKAVEDLINSVQRFLNFVD